MPSILEDLKFIAMFPTSTRIDKMGEVREARLVGSSEYIGY